MRFAPLRFASKRFASTRFGRMSGFSLRHAFQASTSFLSNATCSSFAIGASRFRPGYSVGCRWYAMGHRLEAQGLALSLGALAGLDQEQEPGRASSEAGSGGGMEP